VSDKGKKAGEGFKMMGKPRRRVEVERERRGRGKEVVVGRFAQPRRRSVGWGSVHVDATGVKALVIAREGLKRGISWGASLGGKQRPACDEIWKKRMGWGRGKRI